ncbi:hypothetical protein BDW59DRAFT_160008 [Aspergillus cavernicola]|uniref:Uncharacterized protein n=1 Tax=Aspergillus cavernicola TaxID=176166 RepID=A0ABR4IME8_9EURO
MFCPCAKSYFVVEGLQTEKPRLVHSRSQQHLNSNSRAPLPMQIRPQSRGDIRSREDGQAKEYRQEYRQANGYGPGKVPAILITPVPEEPELAYAEREDPK